MKKIQMMVVVSMLAACACQEDQFGDVLLDDAVDMSMNGFELRDAAYNPDRDSLIKKEPGLLAIEMEGANGAYMVLDANGDIISMGNSYKEVELDPGTYYVIPEDVEFYTALPIIVEIRSGDARDVTILYKKDLSDEKGTLLVDLIPPFSAYYIMDSHGQVVKVGFDSEEFHLKPGIYFVVPQELDGFETPKTKPIKIEPNGVQRVKLRYKNLNNDILPDGTVIASL